MDSILRHQKASQQLKLFLAQHLQLENYIFWFECEKFRNQTSAFADRILCNFITSSAASQVNINHVMRQKIENAITKNEDISIHSFDEAQAEIYKLLVQNNYEAFIKSDICAHYIESKIHEREMGSLEAIDEMNEEPAAGTENI